MRSFCGPYFPALGLNVEIYRVNLRIQSECRKIRTRNDQICFRTLPMQCHFVVPRKSTKSLPSITLHIRKYRELKKQIICEKILIKHSTYTRNYLWDLGINGCNSPLPYLFHTRFDLLNALLFHVPILYPRFLYPGVFRGYKMDNVSTKCFQYLPISDQYSHFILPEYTRKPKDFGCIQEV